MRESLRRTSGRQQVLSAFQSHHIIGAASLLRSRSLGKDCHRAYVMKASANHQDNRVYEFDSFVLDETEKVLLRDGERVPLTPKALELLIVLVSNAGLVLEKEGLMETVWPETFVEEA